MLGKQSINYLLYYIDMSITDYKFKMIKPLLELERRKKIKYEVVHNNRIMTSYWNLMRLYENILKWH